jgi:hypothetical protein
VVFCHFQVLAEDLGRCQFAAVALAVIEGKGNQAVASLFGQGSGRGGIKTPRKQDDGGGQRSRRGFKP